MQNYKLRFEEIYSNLYDIPSWSSYPIPDEIFSFIHNLAVTDKINYCSKILDAGCGRGRLLHLLENLGFINIWGIDISPTAVDEARERIKVSNVTQADLIKGLPYSQNSFDLIFDLTTTASCNPVYWKTIFNEFSRLLKKNGYLISEMFIRNPEKDIEDSLAKKSNFIPEGLDKIYGLTGYEIENEFAQHFSLEKLSKTYPDSLGRFYMLLKNDK